MGMTEEINIPNNAEIDAALKEFEAKQSAEQTPQAPKGFITPQKEVSGISFETDSFKKTNNNQEADVSKIVQLVMKWSGVKEQKQAEYILLIFVVVALAISFYLFFGNGNTKQKISAEALEQMKQMPVNVH